MAKKKARKSASVRGKRALAQDPRSTLQPKLRMIANGSASVNVLRAEQISALTVPRGSKVAAKRGDDAEPVAPGRRPLPPKFSRARAATMVQANVLVDLKDGAGGVAKASRLEVTARRGRQLAGALPVSELERLAKDPNVLHVELADALNDPIPVARASATTAPARRHFGPAALHGDGKGVLIGIIDVQGFDFSHPDFLAGKQTRFLEIWDQGGSNRPPPEGFDYGSLIKQSHMNAALAESARARVPATDLEPQSEMAPGSHGTHVASIAAGNSGVCASAAIAAVLVSMGSPEQDPDRRKSFYDTTRIIHAIEYLVKLADELDRPLSINISLGTNGHAHDGSSSTSRWIDALLTAPGRAVCVAAGNAGQERGLSAEDIGFVTGRIHTSGRVAARGLTQDIGWIVVGNGVADISENELEIWYEAQDRFSVQVRTPDGDWTREVAPGQYIENEPLKNGTFLSVYNELYHPANGSNYISVYLSPSMADNRPTEGVAPGAWTVRLRGIDVRDGTYHGWIERDDPRPQGVRSDGRRFWNFPSFFAETSNVDGSSISSFACGQHVVAVANLDEMAERINITSSQGPTRDGRSKPDVCAPGTDIVAAKGFAGADDSWISMTGTSMASPYVAGVIGLMLAADKLLWKKSTLTAAQVLALLRRTAQPLPGTDYAWRDDAGFGAVAPAEVIADSRAFANRTEVPK